MQPESQDSLNTANAPRRLHSIHLQRTASGFCELDDSVFDLCHDDCHVLRKIASLSEFLQLIEDLISHIMHTETRRSENCFIESLFTKGLALRIENSSHAF